MGVDFVGFFYVRVNLSDASIVKTWICLYICVVTRALYFELVLSLVIADFLRCLRRFVVRRGIFRFMVFDNG